MKMTLLTLLALLTAVPQSRAAACAYEGLDTDECARVRAITAKWNGSPVGAVVLAAVADFEPVADDHQNPHVDQANALARAKDVETGPCRYNETEGRVEVQKSSFRLSDEALTRCLAAAYAQARYSAVESRWLASLGEHEAFVVKNGALTKIAVDRKLETTAARGLWASFAARELVNAARSDETATGGARNIATDAMQPGGATDHEVRALLGLK
ncbi:MAG: hypothetical protein HY075_10215 [Deltaproteobacteria bacterium]|nr:hypothetical protein [Deltaproteobacteria bacterium]